MIQALIPAVSALIGKAIDKAVPDADMAAELKHKVTMHAQSMAYTELQGAIDIIKAEAQGDGILQRNWRPLTMLTFVALVVAHWLGWTAPGLSEAQVLALLDIVQVGIGGYVVGRSAEKAVKAWKEKP